MLTRLESGEHVSHVAWLERSYFEDEVEPRIQHKLEFAPELVRELERSPTEWTCLLFTYNQLPWLTVPESDLAVERFRRFAPFPKWPPWFEYSGGEPRLPTGMVRVRIDSGDVALIEEWRYTPAILNDTCQPV
jgi:hypothetical protein